MQKMKKSKTKARSQRAIEMERERLAEEEAVRHAAEVKKARTGNMLNTMICGYGLAAGILAILFDVMFIIATIGMVLSIIGLKRNIDRKESLDYKLALGGLVVCIISYLYRIIPMFIH